MPHFPMFINIKDQPVLIVGGGHVALRKIRKLQPYGPKIVIVAPEILEEIEKEVYTSRFSLRYHEFQKSDLNIQPVMVIAATNQRDVNHQVAELCREQQIPVNVVDDPEACTFLFPALVHQGEFSAGISTGGASPVAAKYFKEQLESRMSDHLDEILTWLESKRPILKSTFPDQSQRAGLFRNLFEDCMKKGRPLTEEEFLLYLEHESEPISVGHVTLVGAGCGKADLITVRGLRALQTCQAVVYDDLIDPALLDAVPETAQRIYMGKRSGAHSSPQQEINQKLIELAQAGLQVVRLKGGDPYLFGRGGEEMLALLEAQIPCDEIPGIPSAIGIPAEAGIPVTHRGASRGLHIITAHTSDTEDGLPSDFDHLANLTGTLVFLMGLKQLPKITARLLKAGKSPDTPSAVLSGGNAPTPKQVRATLATIEQAAKEANVTSPAIIMVGEVTALNFNKK